MLQQKTQVVHCRKAPYDIYIGRSSETYHFGNPFTHLRKSLATVVVASREESIQAFRDWLLGSRWQEIEPKRRQWILERLNTLKGKTLGCWCWPLPCHGTVLQELADEL